MQVPDRANLRPVHPPEHGAIKFQYVPAAFALGASVIAEPPVIAGPPAAQPSKDDTGAKPSPSDRGDGDSEEAAPDFLSFDEGDAAAEDVGTAAEAGPPSAAAGLLQDYVSMGLVPPPPSSVPPPPPPSRPPLLSAAPWRRAVSGFTSPLLRLHQEVVELCRYLTPSPEEATARQEAIARVAEVVHSIWPAARVEVFGSFATGLYLPSSDIDTVILDSGCTNIAPGLKALATALARKSLARNMQIIAKAKVPIIKFEETGSGYNFDMSFDVANGPEASSSVRTLMESLPPMRALVMVLKVFLQQRELNEVYSGGLGSYALLVLVAAFLQTHPSRARQQPAGPRPQSHARSGPAPASATQLEPNLGALLLDFFRLYGRDLANTHVGVSCRRGGFFFHKRDRGFFNQERPYLLAVEDPIDTTNDLGKNSFNISRVRMAFDYAYLRLVAPAAPGESLLERIIRLDPVLFLRAPPVPLPDEAAAAATDNGGEGSSKKGAKRHKQQQVEEKQKEEEEEPKVKAKGKGKGKGKGQDKSAAKEKERGREAVRGKKKKRHRERSLSDDDLLGGSGPAEDSDGGRRRRPGPAKSKKGSHIRFD